MFDFERDRAINPDFERRRALRAAAFAYSPGVDQSFGRGEFGKLLADNIRPMAENMAFCKAAFAEEVARQLRYPRSHGREAEASGR